MVSPIISWMRAQANGGGEEVTSLGGEVSLGIGDLVGSHHDSADQIMEELVVHEVAGFRLYEELLAVVGGGAERSRSKNSPAR